MAFLAPLIAMLPEGIGALFGAGAAVTEAVAAGAAEASAIEGAGLSGLVGNVVKGVGGFAKKNAGSIISSGVNAGAMVVPQVMMMHQMNKTQESLASGLGNPMMSSNLLQGEEGGLLQQQIQKQPLWSPTDFQQRSQDALAMAGGIQAGHFTRKDRDKGVIDAIKNMIK